MTVSPRFGVVLLAIAAMLSGQGCASLAPRALAPLTPAAAPRQSPTTQAETVVLGPSEMTTIRGGQSLEDLALAVVCTSASAATAILYSGFASFVSMGCMATKLADWTETSITAPLAEAIYYWFSTLMPGWTTTCTTTNTSR